MSKLLLLAVAVALIHIHAPTALAAEAENDHAQREDTQRSADDQWRKDAEESIQRLDSDDFQERERAYKRLKTMGVRILPLIHERADAARSAEKRIRLRRLVDDLALISRFNNGLEGWQLTGGRLAFGRDEKSGGHIECTDTMSSDMFLTAPDRFRGDLSRFIGGVLKFDLKDLSESRERPYPVIGTVFIDSPEGGVSRDIVPGEIGRTWQTYGIPLDANAWGREPEQWARILADVSGITVYVECSSDPPEVVAFDRFEISGPAIGPLTAEEFAAHDRNSDDRLNADEFPEHLRILWGGLDANADGWVSKAEASLD